MNEQQLIDAAENGDVSAMKTLAKFYAQQSGAGNDDKVGDVVSFDSIFKEPKRKPELEAKAYKYYRMAAEAGDAESMTETASRIYDDIGTEQNRQNTKCGIVAEPKRATLLQCALWRSVPVTPSKNLSGTNSAQNSTSPV